MTDGVEYSENQLGLWLVRVDKGDRRFTIVAIVKTNRLPWGKFKFSTGFRGAVAKQLFNFWVHKSSRKMIFGEALGDSQDDRHLIFRQRPQITH